MLCSCITSENIMPERNIIHTSNNYVTFYKKKAVKAIKLLRLYEGRVGGQSS